MALTTCPDCSKEHSDQAPACPQCGRPTKAATTTAKPAAQRVKTSEDSALTRSRGCADLVIWPALIGVVVLLIAMARCN